MIFPPTIRLFLVPCINKYKREWIQAYTEECSRTIFVDVRTRCHMVRILIHEVLHVQHPSWSEHRVCAETRKKFNKMTWKGKAELLTTAMSRAKIGYPSEDDNA